MNKSSSFIIGIIAALLFAAGVYLGIQMKRGDVGFSDADGVQKLEEAYTLMSRYYVDELDRARVVENGIQGMIEALDPHSSYIPPVEAVQVQEEYAGSFGGVGLWYEVVDDTARVSSTIDGGPSEAAGVRPGDRIVAVDEKNVTGDSISFVQKLLKGPVRTSVDMTVLRRGNPDLITFDIVRDQVPIISVPAATMLDDSTGYIKISSFSTTTAMEFSDKLRDLINRGATRLVVDLRGNPGGIMESAVAIADEFLPEGQTIVQTRSRHAAATFTEEAHSEGLFEDGPVIVLVNEFSASASEIIAGALQDNDRALIAGQRTFGKALVQQEFALPDGSLLHLTVSRYYTPSGRLIQTPYIEGDREDYYASKSNPGYTAEDVLSLPDSLLFETLGGRPVAGDGGILPDVILKSLDDPEPDQTGLRSTVVQRILLNSADVSFSRQWVDEHEAELYDRWGDNLDAFDEGFVVDDSFRRAFHQSLRQFPSLDDVSFSELNRNREALDLLVKGRIAQQLFGSAGWYHFYTRIDPDLQESMTLWEDATTLQNSVD